MSDEREQPGYEVERIVVAPVLTGDVIVRRDEHDALGALAADLLVHAHNCVRAFGDFHLCISGVDEIEPALLRLLTDPAYRDLPWRRTHLWCFAERLDGGAPERALIQETLAVHADLPREQLHTIDTTRPDAAARFERALRETLAWREKGHDRLDCSLLAPGSAPGDWSAGGGRDELVQRYADRVACTPLLINSSRLIAVLALGDSERGPICGIVRGDHPLAALDPVGGALRWYLNEAACEAG
ncbi:MAG: 6-phosphogluconolactonase [Phycisphaeraceae bacterium]|nr:6-phosphogluconolactonase [Phycisphaeraceae bacterium]MCB9847767.1 6-phosphogluconolactonase [Phycisphaeraceae bacterium]